MFYQPSEVYGMQFPPQGHSSEYTGEHQLTHLNDALLAQLDLSGVEDFEFTPRDMMKSKCIAHGIDSPGGVEVGVSESVEGVQGFLIRPPASTHQKISGQIPHPRRPAGRVGRSWSYRWNAELFAANGYVVVMINPRGPPLWPAFVDGVNGDWGGKPFTDLMTGLDYAEQHSASSTRPASARSAQATRLHGQLDSRPHDALSGIVSTTACSTPSRLRLHGRRLVQSMGVQGQSMGLLRQNRTLKIHSAVVAVALRKELQDAHPRDSRPARLPPRRERRLPALRHAAIAESSQQDALLSR